MRTIFANLVRAGVLVGLLGIGSAYAQGAAKCDNLTGADKERCLQEASRK